MLSFGPLEIAVVVLIALLVFGPRKLPELGSALGKSLSEFKRTVNETKLDKTKEIQPGEIETPHPPHE